MGATSESSWSGGMGAESCDEDGACCGTAVRAKAAYAKASPRPIAMAQSTASSCRELAPERFCCGFMMLLKTATHIPLRSFAPAACSSLVETRSQPAVSVPTHCGVVVGAAVDDLRSTYATRLRAAPSACVLGQFSPGKPRERAS